MTTNIKYNAFNCFKKDILYPFCLSIHEFQKKMYLIIILPKINVWYIFFYTKPRFNCIILLLLFLDLKNMSR